MTSKNESAQTIVFFDGYCGLCSGVIDFLIVRDSGRSLVYSPLQGETARALLTESERTDLDTVVVLERGNPVVKLHKSDAVLHAVEKAGLGSKPITSVVVSVARIFPRCFRDLVYDFVARNRFRIFGRRDSCRAPSVEERKLFLP